METDVDKIAVNLSLSETVHGANTGVRRQMESIRKGDMDAAGFVGAGWDSHVEGACAELAFALWYGIPWSASVNTYEAADFPPDVDIKVRPYRPDTAVWHKAQLNLRPGANENFRYVHVVGMRGVYEIRGWAWGFEAMKPEYLDRLDQNRQELSYLFPNNLLRPMDTLELPEHVPPRLAGRKA